MNANTVKISAVAFLPAVATMIFVQACGGGGDARAQSAADPIEGVWEAAVTQRDCTTNATIATFRSVQALHRGGTLSDTNGSPTTSRGPGFGVWSRNNDGTYTVKFRFFRYAADGSLAGVNVVTATYALSADGNKYDAAPKTEVRDLTGNVLQTVCVVAAGTRFN